MGLFDKFKKNNAASSRSERHKLIVDYVKKHYGREVIRMDAKISDNIELTDSKFGGLPYWERDRENIKLEWGAPLVMVAQINFEKVQLNNPLLPKKGILQFFVVPFLGYGLNKSDRTKQCEFKVVYHPEIDYTITAEEVIKTGMVSNTMLDKTRYTFPILGEFKIIFKADIDTPGASTGKTFDDVLAEAFNELFGEKMEGTARDYLDEEDFYCLERELELTDHQMLGYPNFVYADPRTSEADKAYDVLLLQMCADPDKIMWGDMGVANFFIKREALERADFTDVYYNWEGL